MKTSLVIHHRTGTNVTGRRAKPGATVPWLLLVGLIAGLGTSAIVEAADVTVAWDGPTHNTDGTPLTDLAGYRLYYGTASQSYTANRDVGLVTTATVTNLPSGGTLYFAVACHNALGDESDLSEELAWTPTPIDLSTDSDDDAMADNAELLAGTDPHDPNSVLKMNRPYRTTEPGTTGITVEWTSVTGKYYTVERSTNLMAVTTFGDIVSHVTGQSAMTVYTDSTAMGSGPYYYRVHVDL